MVSAKKCKKTVEWERLEISSENQRQQRNISCKDGHNNGRNGMDLTEAEILRRRAKNIQKNCTKKTFQDPGNHNGVITHLEPDILECEVK